MAPRLESILLEMGAESTQPVTPFVATTSVPQPAKGGALTRGPARAAPDPIGGLVNHQRLARAHA